MKRFKKWLVLWGDGVLISLPFKITIAIRLKWQWIDADKAELIEHLRRY